MSPFKNHATCLLFACCITHMQLLNKLFDAAAVRIMCVTLQFLIVWFCLLVGNQAIRDNVIAIKAESQVLCNKVSNPKPTRRILVKSVFIRPMIHTNGNVKSRIKIHCYVYFINRLLVVHYVFVRNTLMNRLSTCTIFGFNIFLY